MAAASRMRRGPRMLGRGGEGGGRFLCAGLVVWVGLGAHTCARARARDGRWGLGGCFGFGSAAEHGVHAAQ